ncbi:uncharacterized protein [Dermacentor albipictus]|uniref:uncharacterized protein isoform X1 n=1 Tax=Dermacentor albipictus TaxID=60249 RepID=UPI0038FCAA18
MAKRPECMHGGCYIQPKGSKPDLHRHHWRRKCKRGQQREQRSKGDVLTLRVIWMKLCSRHVCGAATIKSSGHCIDYDWDVGIRKGAPASLTSPTRSRSPGSCVPECSVRAMLLQRIRVQHGRHGCAGR